jgi:hypothetical protein
MDLITKMKRGPSLHGAKWRDSMAAHYSRQLAALIPSAPKGCEKYRDELAKLLGVVVPSRSRST